MLNYLIWNIYSIDIYIYIFNKVLIKSIFITALNIYLFIYLFIKLKLKLK